MHANETFDKATADLITAVDNGASGWQMPWHRLANGTPHPTAPRMERARPRHGRRRSQLGRWYLGDVQVVGQARMPGPPRRARRPRGVVEADRTPQPDRRRQDLAFTARPLVRRVRCRTSRRRRPLHHHRRSHSCGTARTRRRILRRDRCRRRPRWSPGLLLTHWLALLAADSRALLTACSHAQRAIDHLNDAARWTAVPLRSLT